MARIERKCERCGKSFWVIPWLVFTKRGRFCSLRCKYGGDPIERFWAKVTKGDGSGCWEWTASVNEKGYGTFHATGRSVLAHRWLYVSLHGPLPPNLNVLHHCDNRRCVRPDHLFVGTQADNVHDMIAKGRDAMRRAKAKAAARQAATKGVNDVA